MEDLSRIWPVVHNQRWRVAHSLRPSSSLALTNLITDAKRGIRAQAARRLLMAVTEREAAIAAHSQQRCIKSEKAAEKAAS